MVVYLDWLTCLTPGEQLLFSSERAKIYRILGWGPFQSRTGRKNPLLSLLTEPFGRPFAITDRRILLAGWEAVEFEAVYDPNSAKKYAESTRAKNEAGVMVILTAAKLYKRLLTALDFDTAVVGINIPSGVSIRKEKYELVLFKPLRTHVDFLTTKAEILDSDSTTFWFTPIIRNYMEKVDVRYDPLLELVQAKAQEMSDLVKELEASAV
jgi:hypothetical protein